ncbi:hypothetical protein A6D98_09865 [Aliivibrio fischeri]|uniref:hypothetical protein n=1 Tax=Aliivibrio fischeri TaxID=668 RepID=UPI00080EC380|nr:hypothetical protein [Aliivibrio fischeri]OCH60896.1 hypothetical protein A6D98_09865 [Aliivibrio fischeri]
MKNNESLNGMIGKTVTRINNYDDIGTVEIFFNDQSSIHISANGNANFHGKPMTIMVIEPNKKMAKQ